ncbi:MAG TPA: TonB-dependent receptor, partial [Chitinophagaceae bacterium]|nr:TonB-dependent receptor [Chitinophagaceae bacterium]
MHRQIVGLACIFMGVGENCLAQDQDTIPVMKEVVVSGIRTSLVKETSFNIQSLSIGKIRQSGALNISDALSKLPGISQLTTGPAISKPVVRGLYGNRVLAVLSGLKFDNQQWQDEHGLGLNDIGIDRIEVIKGPASLLYGSEAIGGILNIIEEVSNRPGEKNGEVNVGLFSNTYGLSVDGGIRSGSEKKNWSVRAGLNSNADYSDGDNNRIQNSRFTGYYLKGSYGFIKNKWTSVNHFMSSLDNFGFITGDNSNSFLYDGRWSRSMKGPHHTVFVNVLSSQNKINLKKSSLDVNLGFQSNLRLEDEGDNHISLNMLLSTFLWHIMWNKQLNSTTELVLSNNSQFENNTNYGSRIIIPDANMIESGFSGFIKSKTGELVLETGIGISLRNIHTFETPGVNTPDKSIAPFNKTLPSVNGSVGLAWNPNNSWNLKTNIGTGFRSGNLAELSSDGLHEGTLRYEIGDPNLKIEQNINSEVSINYSSRYFQISVAAYLNHFLNYIYLAPTGTQYLGFDVFRYKQFDVNLYGSESMLAVNFPFYERLRFETNFSVVTGRLSDGTYLPFIPPAKWTQQLQFRFENGKRLSNVSFFVISEEHFVQDHPAEFETPTDAYWLLNAGIHGNWQTKSRTLVFSVTGNNLFNRNYYDHLSRFKEYGIH